LQNNLAVLPDHHVVAEASLAVELGGVGLLESIKHVLNIGGEGRAHRASFSSWA
jgi:hypothetical protein